jgi:glycosyltransferase involved in cell wall biosynthesis
VVPRVSVIVPVYNNRAQVREAVTSVLAQNLPGLEVVVVDDGSTDDSAGALHDLPVTVIRQDNQGHPSARNTGLARASGELIGFLDSDDVLAPGGLSKLVAWLDARPEADIVGGRPAGIIDDAGRVLRTFELETEGAPERWLDLDHYRAGRFFPVNVWLYVFRRRLFDRLGTFDPRIRFSDDLDLLLRILKEGPVPILNVAVAFRRVHTDNLSLDHVDGAVQLKPECIDELKRIYLKHGVQPPAWNWKPFETGFDLPTRGRP